MAAHHAVTTADFPTGTSALCALGDFSSAMAFRTWGLLVPQVTRKPLGILKAREKEGIHTFLQTLPPHSRVFSRSWVCSLKKNALEISTVDYRYENAGPVLCCRGCGEMANTCANVQGWSLEEEVQMSPLLVA